MNDMKTIGQRSPVSNPSRSDAVSAILDTIKAEFEVSMGNPERVRSGCFQLRKWLGTPPATADLAHLLQLLPLLGKRMGTIVVPLFELFDEISQTVAEPWPFLEGMLAAKEEKSARRALNRALDLVESGSISVGLDIAKFFAEKVKADKCPFRTPECLSIIGKIISRLSLPTPSSHRSPINELYLQEKDYNLRCLAARIMDLKHEPVSHVLAEQIIGQEAHLFLSPYLDYTRATHLDLLHQVSISGKQPLCFPALKKAEAFCGKNLLKEVIAELGWSHLNLGLEVYKTVKLRIGSSFPLMVSPSEALLLEPMEEVHRYGEFYLFVAHGGLHTDGSGIPTCEDPVARFRAYNLNHAYMLADLISFAPLTREKIWRIVNWMDKTVFDFIALFSPYTAECSILPDVYGDLRERIVSELEKGYEEPHLSPGLTRLVQTFENPKALSEVQTLHGLKRYLHQQGLRLGFRLVEASRATNRTVSLAVASSKKILRVARCISYVDFDQKADAAGLTKIPYPVRVVVDGYARQILHGQERLPEVKIFCYGNEVHYYLSFKNHPAFLRIDFSPPLQGGMIDLQYYGVSKYEIDSHPNLSLNAVQEFFRQLDYDVKVKNTHIHARYDKEMALDLGSLCEKAEVLFRLVPYFMEIDWVIGSLNLTDEARKTVAAAWARFFILWGVIPLNQLLTRDRQGILIKIERGPIGDKEVLWSGQGPYHDRFSSPLPTDLFDKIQALLSEMGLETTHLSDNYSCRELGQIPIENLLLCPLRRAVSMNQIIETPEGFSQASPELFRREPEAEWFAKILASDEKAIAASAALAQLVSHLERFLHFQTTGSLNGNDVQRAPLPLCGKTVTIYVLRDSGGITRLAVFTQADTLCLRREGTSHTWHSNGILEASELGLLLRINNYPAPDPASVSKEDFHTPETIRSLFFRENPAQRSRVFPGEKVMEGQKASPGRSVGPVIFGTEGRVPEDLENKLLISPSLRPEDYPFLYKSAGIISTGGGILSHAGLTAMQLRKPALIVRGQWQRAPDGTTSLLYRTLAYREKSKDIPGFQIILRFEMHEQEHLLREGDLAILDSREGTLRILGQEPDVLSFHEGFLYFCETSRRLSETKDVKKILILRGRRLRSRHRIEKLLVRLTDPVLARHAVHEILMSEYLSCNDGSQDEKVRFLSILLKNRAVGRASRDYLLEIFHGLTLRYKRLAEESFGLIKTSNDPYEILSFRLRILRLRQSVEGVFASLRDCGFDSISISASMNTEINRLVRRRLKALRTALAKEVCAKASFSVPSEFHLRHVVRQIARLDLVLDTPLQLRTPIAHLKNQISQKEKTVQNHLENRRILGSEDGGYELFPSIGWKAANLAETERLLGQGLVPPWFAVTNRAFQEVMDSDLKKPLDRIEGIGLAHSPRAAIHMILSRNDLNNIQKSQKIRQLWEDISLPPALTKEVLTAYHRMNERFPDNASQTEDLSESFVAIRSSALEEDTEATARAGEFDTFLFIRGERPLLDYLKRAWSGLWTERAIHNRSVLGTGNEEPGGGVIIQRIARSRVSGVLQTVNMAEDNFREMIINAGWGLGQGIVSGTVAADLILVAKEGIKEDRSLRSRYITNDKQEHVVFDANTGLKTVRAKTLSHQRLQPALEYIELYDLVRIATSLEDAYGYPLDIEFCIEGTKLRILQVRPVAASHATLQETLRHYPLTRQSHPHLLMTTGEIPS